MNCCHVALLCYCTVLYCTVLYCIVSVWDQLSAPRLIWLGNLLQFLGVAWKFDCIVLYCIVILYCIVLDCIVLYCTVLYCTVLYSIVLYCIVLYCIVLCSTVMRTDVDGPFLQMGIFHALALLSFQQPTFQI